MPGILMDIEVSKSRSEVNPSVWQYFPLPMIYIRRSSTGEKNGHIILVNYLCLACQADHPNILET